MRPILICPPHLVEGLAERALSETSALAGVSTHTVSRWRREHLSPEVLATIRRGRPLGSRTTSHPRTLARVAESVRLRKQGLTLAQIGATIGVSREMIRQYLSMTDDAPAVEHVAALRRKKRIADQWDLFKESHAGGMSDQAIGRLFDVSAYKVGVTRRAAGAGRNDLGLGPKYQRAYELRLEGHTWRVIGEMLSIANACKYATMWSGRHNLLWPIPNPGGARSARSGLGKRITEARAVAGLTQWALANQLGVSHSSVVRWEANRSKPDRANRALIERHLNIVRPSAQSCAGSPVIQSGTVNLTTLAPAAGDTIP